MSDTALATEVPQSGFARLFGALAQNPFYRTYWFGNQASTLMMMMQGVAQGYLAYTLTNSAAALGFVGLAQGLPQLLLAPVGGVVADRYAKRNVLIVVQVVLCLSSLAIGILISLNLIAYWHLVVTGCIQGGCFAFLMPTRQSWIPSLVSKEDLPNAIALNNAGLNASRIMGPAIGGLLIAVPWIGVNGIYYMRVAAFAWVLYSLLQIPILGIADSKHVRKFRDELTAGLRFIYAHETLLPLFTLALVTLLLGSSYQMLLPAFALATFGLQSEGLGFMMAAVGIGALCGSLSMAYFSGSKHKGRIQAIAGVSLGVSLLLFGFVSGLHLYGAALVTLIFVGLSNDFYSTINNTLIMLNTDKALYGRVMSVYMMTWSLAPLSAAPFGLLMDKIGAPPTMIIIGGVLALFVLGMAQFHPGYRRIP